MNRFFRTTILAMGALISLQISAPAMAGAKTPPPKPPAAATKPTATKDFANAAWAPRSVRPNPSHSTTIKTPSVKQVVRKPDLANAKLVKQKGPSNAGGRALTRREMVAQLSPPRAKNSFVVSAGQRRGLQSRMRYDFKGRPHNNVKTPHQVSEVKHVSPKDPAKFSWRPDGKVQPSTKSDLRIAQRAMARSAAKKPR